MFDRGSLVMQKYLIIVKVLLLRVQLENESVLSFGNSLIMTAQIALQTFCLEHVDDILKG